MAKISYYDNATNTWIDIPGVQGGTGNFVGDGSSITTGNVPVANGGTGLQVGAANPPQWYSPTTAPYSAVTVTSGTAYSIFNLTIGASVSPLTTYKFDMFITGIANTTTAKTLGFTLNTNNFGSANLFAYGSLGAANASPLLTPITTNTSTTVSSSSTGTIFQVAVSGLFRTGASTGGWVNPQISISAGTNPTLTINANSFMSITPIGASTDIKNATVVGTWS